MLMLLLLHGSNAFLVIDFSLLKSEIVALLLVLFIVYINDISDCVLRGSKMKLYADDAKVYTVIDDLNSQAILQKSLDSVLAWSRHWQLALSESKCAVLHLSVGVNHSGLSEYFISNYRLLVIDCFTDLGVTLNSKFNFSTHIYKISHRASLRSNSQMLFHQKG